MPNSPILYESHSHTPLCKHASGSPSDYAAVAEARGLKGIIITCHAPLPDNLGIEHRMAPEQYDEYIDLVAAAREEFAAVDLTGYFFPGYPAPPSREYISKLKRRLHVLGLDLSGTGVRNDFATADAQVRANGVRLVQEWIAVAADLGAPVIRVFAGPHAPFRNWEKVAPGASRTDVETWMAEALFASIIAK